MEWGKEAVSKLIRILSVSPSSPAENGIRPGEGIVSINGEQVIDEIDF